jgi:hypothetical protein
LRSEKELMRYEVLHKELFLKLRLKYFLNGYKRNLISLLLFKVKRVVGYNDKNWNWFKRLSEKFEKYISDKKEGI